MLRLPQLSELWHSRVDHSRNLASPAQLLQHQHGFDAWEIRLLQELGVGGVALPLYTPDGMETSLMEAFLQLDVFPV